ncbi:MAG: hypothetical protein HY834_09000 [Devosia nanyangense]|uniref:Uncharacterized protein n=1 Tax=Devosia nanyangense TaxID=1228055 RepID=A0A933NWG4_9HYPH|nr:hypothetical protein [Devosia nanyangense]
MSPSVHLFHSLRLKRMLADLQLEPGSVTADAEFAVVDDLSRRRLTPPLNNQTLAEGLVSAIKLAAAGLESLSRDGAPEAVGRAGALAADRTERGAGR